MPQHVKINTGHIVQEVAFQAVSFTGLFIGNKLRKQGGGGGEVCFIRTKKDIKEVQKRLHVLQHDSPDISLYLL